MAKPKTVFFFRSEINQFLLLESEDRVEIMAMIENMKDQLSNMEGINFFEEWKKLFETITKAWQKDVNKPFFELEEQFLEKLAFFLDFIAFFFLYNGSEEDNEYLKEVDEFFKQHNKQRSKGDLSELFKRAFKNG